MTKAEFECACDLLALYVNYIQLTFLGNEFEGFEGWVKVSLGSQVGNKLGDDPGILDFQGRSFQMRGAKKEKNVDPNANETVKAVIQQ